MSRLRQTILRLFLFFILLLNLEANENIFTKEEKNWMQKHPVITFVGDPKWLPFEAFDKDGNYVGIVAEYLSEVEAITGLSFKTIQTSSWEESIRLMNEKKADVISETTDSQMRSFLKFTNPYIENHIVIIMNEKSKYVDSLSLIQDKKIAIIKGYGYVPKMQKAYPTINFIEVQNITEGLKRVASAKADALICTMALGSYHINKDGFVNLRIVGKTEFFTTIGYGIQPELEPLIGILNKAIIALDNGVKQKILKKWILHKYVEKPDYQALYIAIGIFTFIFLMGLSFYFRLKQESSKRIEIQQKMLEQQARMAAIGEMMDAVAHQWKQPLNALSMYRELLSSDYKDGLVNQKYIDEMGEGIEIQIEHMLSTLSEFRSFFRPNKKADKINILKSINSTLLLIKDELLKNTINVNMKIDEKINIIAIENEFKHVILNIISNAKDAFIENNISNREINIQAQEVGKEIQITICDNAGGVPEYIISDIFKANVTSKESAKGTGIGLYMSTQIIEKSGGSIKVYNKNSGACFSINWANK